MEDEVNVSKRVNPHATDLKVGDRVKRISLGETRFGVVTRVYQEEHVNLRMSTTFYDVEFDSRPSYVEKGFIFLEKE